MESIKAFSKAFLLCGGMIIASGTLQAETISQNSGVTVVRGEDNAEAAAQRQSSRGRAGVAVFRGQSSDVPANTAPVSRVAPPTGTQQIVGGQNLWVHDAGASTVTACNLRYDFYGNQQVRCRAARQ